MSFEIDLPSLFGKYKSQVAIGLAGIVLVALGVFLFLPRQPEIEIIPISSTPGAANTIFVDIEGAVQKPGVYELPTGSLLNDLLIRAGGLSAAADRDWAAKNLNLAQKLADGNKFFVAKQGNKIEANGSQVAGSQTTTKVNLNTAPLSELDALWGIGAARAKTIIDNRPYQNIEELLTRKVIPQNVYERIKNEIVVY